ncbi:MAG: dephospho-CoA kinase [Burkholderiaceae bacterium]
MRNSPFLIGLTGGIGSGKSTIADAFVALGAALVDTDAVAHQLTAPGGRAIEPIRAAFGDEVIATDGSLDRPAMRKLAFSDAGSRQKLEAIIHPLIGAECTAQIEQAHRSGAAYILLAVPLLVESGNWLEKVDRVLVIDCDEALQISRVKSRSGLADEQIRAIMDVQASREERRAAAHDVIDNSSDLEAAQAQVRKLHETYLELAQSGNRP